MRTFTVDLGQLVTVSGTTNLYQADVATATLYVRRYDESNVYVEQFAGTNNGGGNWTFEVPNGSYQMWKSASPDTTAGNRYDKWHGGSTKYKRIVEEVSVTLDDAQTINSVKTFTSQQDFSSGLKVTSIVESTLNAGVTIEGVAIEDSVISSALTISGALTVGNVAVAGDMTLDTGSVLVIPDDAVNPTEVPNLSQVQDLIAAVSAVPGQQGSNVLKIIAGGTVVANEVYRDINTALTAISGNDDIAQYILKLEEGSPFGTTNDNVFYAGHSSLKNYCHLIGEGINTRLVIGTSGTSTTKIMTVENCSVWLGANDITAARTYASMTFRNCDIYAYKNLTLNNCFVKNCNIYQPASFETLFTGSTEVLNTRLTQTVSTDTGTGIRDYIDGLSTSYTMPEDLSLAP